LTKKIQVTLSDECHAVLKAYAGFFGKTMSDVMYMFTRQEIQQQARDCKFVQQLLDAQKIIPDKRASKNCWGHKCLVCVHAAKCQAGLTDDTFMPSENIKDFLKEESPLWDLYES
tara:strand:+ start:49 stop:393 length:345 start_codon:yes stop_codon:yes gene_type:complete